MDPGRKRHAGRWRAQLLAHLPVVHGDRLHDEEDHRRRQHDDPRAGGELRDEHDHEHEPGGHGARAVHELLAADGAALAGLRCAAQLAGPVPHHPRLAEREREEHAEDVQLDQPRDVRVERHDEEGGQPGQHEDPVREHEPVAAVGELVGEIAVPAEQRRQHREAVEGGVGGEHEDRGRESLEEEEHAPSPNVASPIWLSAVRWVSPWKPISADGVLGHVHVRRDRERGDPAEHRDRQERP